MTHMVTRCPKCATSFRITSAQLQSAKGAVRCGSCLHIFKAQDHLVGGAPKPAAPDQSTTTKHPATKTNPAAKQPATKPATKNVSGSTAATQRPKDAPPTNVEKPSAAKKTSPAPRSSTKGSQGEQKLIFDQEQINRELAEDDFLISDDMDEDPKKKESNSEYEFDGFLDLDHLPKQSISLFDREIRKEAPEKDEPETDESWAMNLLDEADDENRAASSKPVSKKESQKEKQVHEEQKSHFEPTIRILPEPEEIEATEEIEAAPAPASSMFKRPIFSLIGEKSTDADDESDRHKGHSGMRAFDSARSSLLMNIKPEPVIMTARRKRGWYKKKMWAGLSLLMILVLFVQVAWLQFDSLSVREPYRSFYSSICPTIGCKLKPLVDRTKIRAYNLVVRNHPKIKDALMVDAILLNNAPFDQPFPDLVLAFSTMADVPVASRRFTPAEYLRGELAGTTLMPKNQPVHLTLELVDPGPDAVNYHAYIPE